MGIESFIKKICVQTAVYWGNPTPDGYGRMTFDYPVEIKVRWDIKNKLVTDSNGKEVVSVATILCPEDLVEEGFLFLGTIDDLYDFSSGNIDPKSTPGAVEIISREKVSMIKSTTQFVRTYYIGENGK